MEPLFPATVARADTAFGLSTRRTVLVALAAFALIGGCASTPDTEPAPTTTNAASPIELAPQSGSIIPAAPEATATAAPQRFIVAKGKRYQPPMTPAQTRSVLNSLTARYDRNENLCAGLFTGNNRVAVPKVNKPPVGVTYADPVFRTRVTRISNAGSGSVIKPMYSTIQAWNADESLMILYHSGSRGPGHHLYNGQTYEYIRRLDISPSDIEQVFWSHTEPDSLYYINRGFINNNKLLKLNVRSSTVTPVADLSPMCGRGVVPTAGNDVQMPSYDDDLFGFRCRKNGSGQMYMHSYRVSTGEITSAPIGEGTPWGAWVAPNAAPSGQALRMNDKVIATNLMTGLTQLDLGKHNEHSSLGRTHNGADAYYATAFDPAPGACGDHPDKGVGHLIEHNMTNGKCRPIITESMGYPYTNSGTHVSAVNHLRPGWVALSSIGYPEEFAAFESGQPASALFSEIYLASTDPANPTVCRLAHHRTYGKNAKRADYVAYLGEPHVTISPSGTRILFGSDWYDSGSVDTYVIELPAFRR